MLGEHRTGTNAYRQTFAYDPPGNRTLKNADGVRTTFNYDASNQLTYSLAAAGRTTYTFDAAGNQRVEQPPVGSRTTTTWDYENQPTQYRLPTGSPVTMTYNADNRRVQSQQSTTVTKFVRDMPTRAYLSELNSANATQVVYTDEPAYYGSVISQRRGSTTHSLHADALGSTRILTTSAGASSDTYLYDAWGNPITSSGSTVNPFRWVGKYGSYFDTVTGLFYIRARTYQPTVARWTSVDPLDFVDGTNLYAYVNNVAVLNLDPSGLAFTQETPPDPFLEDPEPPTSKYWCGLSQTAYYAENVLDPNDTGGLCSEVGLNIGLCRFFIPLPGFLRERIPGGGNAANNN